MRDPSSRRPSSPSKSNNLLLAFFGGSFLGIGLAFFFEYLDGRIRQPEEIKAHIELITDWKYHGTWMKPFDVVMEVARPVAR